MLVSGSLSGSVASLDFSWPLWTINCLSNSDLMKDRFIYHYRRSRSLLQRGLRSLRVRGLKASLAMLSPRLKKPLKQGRAEPELRFPGPADVASLNEADFGSAQPYASLIIPIHDKLDLTLQCLASLRLHPTNASFEVIIVDDASTDASFDFLSGIRGLRLVRMPEQSGYVYASNKGAEQARGNMLVFLNNDTVVQAGWLDALLKTFDQFPDTGIAGAKLLYPNGLLQEAGGAVFRDGSVWNLGRFEQADNPRFNYVREVDYVSGAVLAIRKNVFDELGGFDSHFAPGYFEDTDLAMRVHAHGLKIRYQPFSRVVHIEGATSGTRLDTGMKAFQIPHQLKFAKRWHAVLANYPARPDNESESKALAFTSPRKKVLVLDEHTPKPEQDSGSLRLFQLMQILQGEDCDVHFLPADLAYHPLDTSRLQQQAIACSYRPWTKNMLDWLQENAGRFDVLIASRVDLLHGIYDTLRKYFPGAKLIFDTVDLHHVREMQEAEIVQSDTLRKNAMATRTKEFALIEKCDETWVVSESERHSLSSTFPGKNIRRISNIHPLRHGTPTFDDRKGILFVGNFRHPPNQDGLQWFLESVLPIVHAARPDIPLHIAGAGAPEQWIKKYESMNVTFLGHVHDIEKCIDDARINIAPLRYGAGAKGKISQALASGLPSIATGIAADGMCLKNGESVILAETPQAFSDSILALYENETLWNLVSKNAYAVAEEFFSGRAAEQEIRAMLSS